MATLKGVFPDPKPVRRKNFIHENVKNLRRMEQYFHTNKELEELQKLQIQKHHRTADKYQNISSRVNSSLATTKQQLTDLKDSGPVLRSKSPKTCGPLKNSLMGARAKRAERTTLRGGTIPSEPNQNKNETEAEVQPKFRSRGIQTLDDDCMDDLYAEGTIRYPSSRSPRQPTDKTPRGEPSPSSDRGDVTRGASNSPPGNAPPSGDGVDFVKLNKQQISVACKMATQLNHGVPPASYRKGVVPKYLRERKEAQQQEEERTKAEMLPADCPEGHVPLPDSERKETLRMLKKNYQEYVNELNKLPIKTDTLRSQRRKMEIEKQLTKIEEGIKVFSRPKVYVKVNA